MLCPFNEMINVLVGKTSGNNSSPGFPTAWNNFSAGFYSNFDRLIGAYAKTLKLLGNFSRGYFDYLRV